jgi:uncharacterized protein YecE (DUF72 family)
MTWYFGTSGWSYKNWDRQFYPKDIPADQKLAHYAKTFSAVEVNTTFYHYLTRDTCRHWASLVPEGFRFSVKLHRYLTQMKKLKLDDKAKAARDRFFEGLAELEARTGVILIQLPPSLKKNLERLQAFLEALPSNYRYALEFRNGSWFDAEVASLLEQYQVGVVVSDSPEWACWQKATGGMVYARFHGRPELFKSPYEKADLQAWAQTLASLKAAEQPGWVFFNNTEQGHAVKNGEQLRALMDHE